MPRPRSTVERRVKLNGARAEYFVVLVGTAIADPMPVASPDRHAHDSTLYRRTGRIEVEHLRLVEADAHHASVETSSSWCQLSCGRPNQPDGSLRLATSCSARNAPTNSAMASGAVSEVTQPSCPGASLGRKSALSCRWLRWRPSADAGAAMAGLASTRDRQIGSSGRPGGRRGVPRGAARRACPSRGTGDRTLPDWRTQRVRSRRAALPILSSGEGTLEVLQPRRRRGCGADGSGRAARRLVGARGASDAVTPLAPCTNSAAPHHRHPHPLP
jgi:hypothetical protein